MDRFFPVWSGFLSFPNMVRLVPVPVFPKKAKKPDWTGLLNTTLNWSVRYVLLCIIYSQFSQLVCQTSLLPFARSPLRSSLTHTSDVSIIPVCCSSSGNGEDRDSTSRSYRGYYLYLVTPFVSLIRGASELHGILSPRSYDTSY
jgi:hypothetical protein